MTCSLAEAREFYTIADRPVPMRRGADRIWVVCGAASLDLGRVLSVPSTGHRVTAAVRRWPPASDLRHNWQTGVQRGVLPVRLMNRAFGADKPGTAHTIVSQAGVSEARRATLGPDGAHVVQPGHDNCF